MNEQTPTPLQAAVAALTDFNAALDDMLVNRFAAFDGPLTSEQITRALADVKRMELITKPFPLVDAYKGIPARRVQPRIWSGTITNPNGPWGFGSNPKVKAARYADDPQSVYYDAGI